MDRRHKGTCAARSTNLCGISPFRKEAEPNHDEEKCFKSDGAWRAGKSNCAAATPTSSIHPSCVEVIERIDASSSPSAASVVPHLNFPLPYDRTKNQKSFLSPSFIDCRSSPFRSLCRISNGIHGFLPVTRCLSCSCIHNHNKPIVRGKISSIEV